MKNTKKESKQGARSLPFLRSKWQKMKDGPRQISKSSWRRKGGTTWVYEKILLNTKSNY